MNAILKSWKTTAPGIIIAAIVIAKGIKTGEWISYEQLIPLLASVGLLAARDSDVSSEDAGAK